MKISNICGVIGNYVTNNIRHTTCLTHQVEPYSSIWNAPYFAHCIFVTLCHMRNHVMQCHLVSERVGQSQSDTIS